MTEDSTQPTKHTPGPYRVSPVSAAIERLEKDRAQYICTFPYDTTVAQQDEIASLLNKGTHFEEMLAALKGMYEASKGVSPQGWKERDAWAAIRSAIAKAEPIRPDERPLDTSAILALG